MRLQVLLHLDYLVRLSPVGLAGRELEVLEHLGALLRLLLRGLAVGQPRVGRHDIAHGGDVSVLALVGGLQQRHHRVALRLQPHLVLLQAALVHGSHLLQHLRVLSLKVAHEVVNLLRRAVVVRVGQFGQPRRIQLIVVCHHLNLFSSFH